jgi:hypothetical protein
MSRTRRKYLTVTYIHVPRSTCGYQFVVRTAVPPGHEHHALSYSQAISAERCPRCTQRRRIEHCICGSCVAGRAGRELTQKERE